MESHHVVNESHGDYTYRKERSNFILLGLGALFLFIGTISFIGGVQLGDIIGILKYCAPLIAIGLGLLYLWYRDQKSLDKYERRRKRFGAPIH